jgi:hypothetical protein
MVLAFDYDSDGDIGWGDVIEAVSTDGDQAVSTSEAAIAVGYGITCWGCLSGAVAVVLFVVGIQLGQEHVHRKTLQMDIREEDIIYDTRRVWAKARLVRCIARGGCRLAGGWAQQWP